MDASQDRFVADHYAPRAQDYVESLNHSTGEDLDELESLLRGRGLGSVLDLGCGGGHVSYRAAPHVGAVMACDITASMLDAVSRTAAARGLRNIETRQAAAEALPFADGVFDGVLCRFTAHHWGNFEAGLREARRVVNAGGLAVFMDSVCPADALLDTHLQAVELLRDPSHVRNYSVAEWQGALGRAAFAAERVTVRKLRMDFPVWIARTRTPPLHAEAIRSLQRGAPESARAHFAIGEDGGFDLDTVTIVARAA